MKNCSDGFLEEDPLQGFLFELGTFLNLKVLSTVAMGRNPQKFSISVSLFWEGMYMLKLEMSEPVNVWPFLLENLQQIMDFFLNSFVFKIDQLQH